MLCSNQDVSAESVHPHCQQRTLGLILLAGVFYLGTALAVKSSVLDLGSLSHEAAYTHVTFSITWLSCILRIKTLMVHY